MINEEVFRTIMNGCKGLVMNCDCSILLLNVMGTYRAYVAPEVRLKTRECRYNEVRDAQDVTTLVLNVGINFANGMTHQVLMEKTQSIHKESFKFGTDDYMWITKVDLNR